MVDAFLFLVKYSFFLIPDRTNNALARLDIRPKIQAVIYESMEKK